MTPATGPPMMASSNKGSGLMSQKNSKPAEIRTSNIRAAKALSDAIRTSLGPRGMDKMIQDAKGEVTITSYCFSHRLFITRICRTIYSIVSNSMFFIIKF